MILENKITNSAWLNLYRVLVWKPAPAGWATSAWFDNTHINIEMKIRGIYPLVIDILDIV